MAARCRLQSSFVPGSSDPKTSLFDTRDPTRARAIGAHSKKELSDDQ